MAQFLVKGAINKEQSGSQTTPDAPQSSGPPPVTNEAATITGAKDFDPPPDGNGEEHPEDVKNTYDGKSSTTWTTMSYKKRADLGGQKEGVGIVYDLGELTNVSQVTVDLVGQDTDLDVMVPKNDPNASPTAADGWKSVASAKDANDSAVLKPAAPVQSRYVLVWLTKLPKEGGGYRGEISEVKIQK
jgi:hypothetical protein